MNTTNPHLPSAPQEPRLADYYTDLGLQQWATPGAIKGAFHDLAKIHHPDKRGTGGVGQSGSARDFCKVREAYECLSDPQKRALYDAEYGQLKQAWETYRRWQSEAAKQAEQTDQQKQAETEAIRVQKAKERTRKRKRERRLRKKRAQEREQASRRAEAQTFAQQYPPQYGYASTQQATPQYSYTPTTQQAAPQYANMYTSTTQQAAPQTTQQRTWQNPEPQAFHLTSDIQFLRRVFGPLLTPERK